jgi:hypothetical protein
MKSGFEPGDSRLARPHAPCKLALRNAPTRAMQNHKVRNCHALFVLLFELGILRIEPPSRDRGSNAVS